MSFDELPDLWTVEQTAGHFGVVRKTVYNWIKAGKIRAIRIGRTIRIPKSEIIRLLGVEAA